jgi:TPR repeat protein
MKLRFIIGIGMCSALVGLLGAQPSPPRRVARLSYVNGNVSLRPDSAHDFVPAALNAQLSTGDHLWTDRGSYAELQIGSAVLRVADETALKVLRLDDRTAQFSFAQGAINVRVSTMNPGEVIEVDTPAGVATLTHPGSYRLDVKADGSVATLTVRAGAATVKTAGLVLPVQAAQRAHFSSGGRTAPDLTIAPAPDAWDEWCSNRDAADNRALRPLTRDPPAEANGASSAPPSANLGRPALGDRPSPARPAGSYTADSISIPARLYECEADQCAPGGGGSSGTWDFQGPKGHAKWVYGAVANLTVESFSADHVVIRRADPPGTYSGGLTAVYTGTIHGDRVDGSVSWNGGAPGKWFAFIHQSCDPDNPFHVGPDEALLRGQLYYGTSSFTNSACWFFIGASQENARAQAMLAFQLREGKGLLNRNPVNAFYFAQKSANQGDYYGESLLAEMYQLGEGTTADKNKAATWAARAKLQSPEYQAKQRAQANSQTNAAASALLMLFGAAMIGGLTDDAPQADHDARMRRYMDCKLDNPEASYKCGYPPQ